MLRETTTVRTEVWRRFTSGLWRVDFESFWNSQSRETLVNDSLGDTEALETLSANSGFKVTLAFRG